MLRVTSTLFLAVFVIATIKTALTFGANGDTLVIIAETVVCVGLLSGLIYCRNCRRLRSE